MYKYTIEYTNRSISKDVLDLIKKRNQKIEQIDVDTIYTDTAIGFKIRLSHASTDKAEDGRVLLLRELGTVYEGNDVWSVEV